MSERRDAKFKVNVINFLAPVLAEPQNPCLPSPCGPFSQCRDAGGSPSCSCLSGYIGIPPQCKPECISNSECPSHLACINQKCRDPCPGTCGGNADCRVVSHSPVCQCLPGYTGDPFSQCLKIQCKLFLKRYYNSYLIMIFNNYITIIRDIQWFIAIFDRKVLNYYQNKNLKTFVL